MRFPSPKPMSEQMIREKALGLFWDYVREVGEGYILRNGVNFDDMYDAIIYPRYEISLDTKIDLGYNENDEEILGQFIPEDNIARISERLVINNDPRRIFTTVHEVVGHGVLHGNFLRETKKDYPALYSTDKSMKFENTFEWQANTMAKNFICPEGLVLALYWKVFGTRRKIPYVGPRRYCLNVNGKGCSVWAASPYQLAWEITKRIKHYFWGLSKESITYQVLNVAVEANGYSNRDFGYSRKTESIGGLLSNMR